MESNNVQPCHKPTASIESVKSTNGLLRKTTHCCVSDYDPGTIHRTVDVDLQSNESNPLAKYDNYSGVVLETP